MQSKPQLYKDSSPCMRCSFVKCESGNDLKWKEINENVAEQIMKGCVTGNWINGLADGVSASQHSSVPVSEGMMKGILMIEENQEDYLQEPVYDQYQEAEEVSEGILMIEEIVEQPPVYDIEVEAEIGDDQAEGITLEGL
uniref:Uncharacterized protein n=1 Tax=Fagus sylvatica TaxID=28930 RepID=A0A2N9FBI1_FAGSY